MPGQTKKWCRNLDMYVDIDDPNNESSLHWNKIKRRWEDDECVVKSKPRIPMISSSGVPFGGPPSKEPTNEEKLKDTEWFEKLKKGEISGMYIIDEHGIKTEYGGKKSKVNMDMDMDDLEYGKKTLKKSKKRGSKKTRRGSKKSKKRGPKKTHKKSRRGSNSRTFGTIDRRTLDQGGPNLYNVSYGPDGILMANDAFGWNNDPMQRALMSA